MQQNKKFVANMKKVRKEKGFTQKALGELVGISEAMVRQYELGLRNPKIETASKIAEALECSVYELQQESVNQQGAEGTSEADYYRQKIIEEVKNTQNTWILKQIWLVTQNIKK